jgi:hypothetical protein
MALFGAGLFTVGFDATLLKAAAAVVVAATVEEFALLFLLPEWTADVRGLPWVISRRDRDRGSRDREEAARRV